MHHLIVLPGNSPRNLEWGEACAAHFGAWFDSVFVQQYGHWAQGEQWIDLTKEERLLQTHVATLPPATKVYIFAKSIGSILAVNAIAHQVVVSAGVVFFGMPLDHAVPEVWQGSVEPLATLAAPTIAIHNDADPTTSYIYTRNALVAHAPQVTFVTMFGTTHDYLEFMQYEAAIREELAL